MPVVPSNLRYTRLYIRVGRYFCIEIRQVACDQSLLAVPKNILSHFEGTVQGDFRPSLFFHHSNQPEPLTNGLKYFRFWFRFRWDTRIFPNLRAASYGTKSIIKICGEISAQYDTAGSHPILRGVNSHFLNLLHRPLKGQCHKNNYEFLVW